MSLSDQNRAVIERDLGHPIKSNEPDDIATVCFSDLNRYMDAARAEGRPSPEKEEDASIIRELQHIRIGMLDQYQAATILERLVGRAQKATLSTPPVEPTSCFECGRTDFADRVCLSCNDIVDRSTAPEPGYEADPVAWTNKLGLDKLKTNPKQASAVWGLPNGSIKIPLYTSPVPVAISREEIALLADHIWSAMQSQEEDVRVNGARHPGLLEPMRDILRDIHAEAQAILQRLSNQQEGIKLTPKGREFISDTMNQFYKDIIDSWR